MKFKAAMVKSRNVINKTVQQKCHIYSSFALSVLDYHINCLSVFMCMLTYTIHVTCILQVSADCVDQLAI